MIIGVPKEVKDHESRVGIRMGWRQNQIAVRRGIAARFREHPLAQTVRVIAEITHFVIHRRAGDIEHAADDDSTGFAAGVGIDGLHHVGYSHRAAAPQANGTAVFDTPERFLYSMEHRITVGDTSINKPFSASAFPAV